MEAKKLNLPLREFVKDVPSSRGALDRLGLSPDSEQAHLPVQVLLKVKGLDSQLFLKSLQTTPSADAEGPVFPESFSDDKRALNFLGYVPCSIREDFRQGVWKKLQASGYTQESFPWYVPGGCGAKDLYEGLWQEKEIKALPQMIVSLGFGDFFREGFVKSRLETGDFAAVPGVSYAPEFVQAGIPDPLGQYSIYSVQTYVILADKLRLQGRPLPEKWVDLADPCWKDDLIVGGDGDEVSEVLLQTLYQSGGEAAIQALARNVKDGWHAAQMAKAAGSGSPQGAALYVVPWFFADSCPQRDKVEIHWPAEGGLASPLYVLVRQDASDKTRELAQFLMGKEIGSVFAQNHYPAASVAGLPPGKKLRWLGWDYIRSHNLPELGPKLQNLFKKARG